MRIRQGYDIIVANVFLFTLISLTGASYTTLVILYRLQHLCWTMLRDALSDGIRVGSHFIKECALQLKASISLKGLQLVMDKNQEVAEAYSKNINVRKTKTAAEFAFFHESTKCRRLIRKKAIRTWLGSPITHYRYILGERNSIEKCPDEGLCTCKKKKERIHLPQWSEIIRDLLYSGFFGYWCKRGLHLECGNSVPAMTQWT